MAKLPQPRRLVALLCAMGLGAWAAPSCADVQYKFSGFGTLGAVKTNTDETEFRTSVEQFQGAGKTLDIGVDSKLGLQGSAVFSNGVTLTAQMLGARRNGEEFDAGFEWAYAQYTGIDGLDLKAGRVVLPAFLVSDSRMVGYATPWLRVSPLVYAMMPLSNVDGAQVTYRKAVGSTVASVQFTRGASKAHSKSFSGFASPYVGFGMGGPDTLYGASTGETETSKIFALNATLEMGDWTFRISQITDRTKLQSIQDVPATMTDFGLMPATQGGRLLEFNDKFQEIGLQYDNGTLVVMAERVKRSTKDEEVQRASAWYIAGGYRFGSVMPYVMLSEYKQPFTYGSTFVPPKATGTAVGVRYDFANNLALKAELAQYKNNSLYITTDSASPGVANKKINVMSVALDFVF